jgi:hypothetical protein
MRLAILISAYSNAVRRYCDRQFVGKNPGPEFDPNSTSTISYEYDGNGYLNLGPWEARQVVSVTLDGKSLPLYNALAPTSESYSPTPRQQTTEGTFLSIALPRRERSSGSYVGHYGTAFVGGGYCGIVDVVAKWGVVDLPRDVELATCIAVGNAYRNPEGAASRSVGEFSMVEVSGNGANLPQDSRALLAPYQRS